MDIIILLSGLGFGFSLNILISKILKNISGTGYAKRNIIAVFINALCFFYSYIKFGISISFLRISVLTALLVIIAFVDLHTKIIPDFMVVITLVIGITLSFLWSPSLIDTTLGMLCGSGILFLLSLVPNSMGGGDIKLMFAIGSFLGLSKTIWALLFAFAAASIISLLLLIFKTCGRKDYIPFGPFLALGSFISLIFFT